VGALASGVPDIFGDAPVVTAWAATDGLAVDEGSRVGPGTSWMIARVARTQIVRNAPVFIATLAMN
jgi:hypothetical protein